MNNFVVKWSLRKGSVKQLSLRFSKFEDALACFLDKMGEPDQYLYVELQANKEGRR